MLRLVLRRAVAQRRLVGAVTALVTLAATLLGVCALLLGPTQELAFTREVQRSPAQDVEVDAFLVDLDGGDLVDVRASAARALTTVLGPLAAGTVATATSEELALDDPAGGPDQLAYLAAGDGLEPRAALVTGRWPEPGSGETTVPDAAATALGVALGDVLTVQRTSGVGEREAVPLEVVGTFRPRSPLGWESDPLVGAGYDPRYGDGARPRAASGPFVVDETVLAASGADVAGLRVTATPDLARADQATTRRAVDRLEAATGLLTAELGDRVRITRVDSDLPVTLERVEAQRGAGRAVVLVAVLLATVLALAALLLAARLVAAVRDEERVLLVSLGAGRGQQVRAAVLEALLLAAIAAAIALPASAVLHSALTRTSGPAAAGLDQPPQLTGGLVLAVLVSAAALTAVLALATVDSGTVSASTRRRWALARTGADVTLLGVAVVVALLGWRQLTTAAARADSSAGDLTLTLAPVLTLTATVVVVVRLVPLLLRGASRLALRSRSLVGPLSVQQAARRAHPGTAMVLVAAAVAAAVFGLGLRATWERSQVDQAAVRTGSDLSLTLPDGVSDEDARAVAGAVTAAAAGGGASAVSAVVDRPVAIGRYVGEPGAAPTLVALDSRVAGTLVRGRLEDGATWGGVGAALDPGPAVTGVGLGSAVTLQGTLSTDLPVTATATAVVQDPTGLRRALAAPAVPLDGQPHPLTWSAPLTGDEELVALSLHLTGPRPRDRPGPAGARVAITLAAPGAAVPEARDWVGHPTPDSPVRDVSLSVAPGAGGGAELLAGADVDTGLLSYGGGDLLATAFATPDAVPVAVSTELADALDADVGAELAGVVGGAEVPLRVAAVVSAVPSAPGGVAVLADADTLSRGLVAAGELDSLVDAWWLADPGAATVRDLRSLGVGEVRTREEATHELVGAPLQAGVPAVLAALVVAATVLLLAGVALVTGADQRRRTGELTRLRALGLSRRGSRRLLLAEHASFLAPVVVLGALVGVGAAVVMGPLLVRSDLGGAPVPAVVAAWRWGQALLVLGVVVLGSALVTWIVAARQVRASDTTGLRTGEG